MKIEAATKKYFEEKKFIEGNIDFPENIQELIDRAADLYPTTLAINCFEQEPQAKSITYADLRVSIYKLADGLQQQGIKKSTHVAVIMSNRIEYPITWLAIAVIGAVMIPVNPAYTSAELDYVLNDSDAEFLVIEDKFLPTLKAMSKKPETMTDESIIIVTDKDTKNNWNSILLRGSKDAQYNYQVNSDDLLNIQYTSGTTGFPKGCMQTQKFWIMAGCIAALRNKGIKSVLADAPFFYFDNHYMVIMGLYSGMTVHVSEGMSVSRFLDWIDNHQIELAYFPAPLLETPPSSRDSATSLKKFIGFALNAEMTRLVEERFNVLTRDSFGMTEVGVGLLVPDTVNSDVALDSCGLPAPFREVKVVDDNGNEVESGNPGELWMKGAGIINGYYKKPEANKETFIDGWFRTGDVFIADELGYHTIVGRIKDMIRRSMENISALEVETAIRSKQGIEDAAAIAVPDKKRDEEVKIYVLLSAGYTSEQISPADIIIHCQQRLAP
ncbi:MAG: class I adenylate-forming enzyme family protein, partial [Woeseiaceae bacterium]|nr:class I adenylate-forming enzyme family protein [Woeseiaceae bacterium]